MSPCMLLGVVIGSIIGLAGIAVWSLHDIYPKYQAPSPGITLMLFEDYE